MRVVMAIRTACGLLIWSMSGLAWADPQPVAAIDRAQPRRREPERDAGSPPEREQPAPPQRHTARSVAGAPVADHAEGIARPEPRSGGDRAREVARALLFVPRLAFWVVNAPIRGGHWLVHRYQVQQRVRTVLFNEEGTAGVFPIASARTG